MVKSEAPRRGSIAPLKNVMTLMMLIETLKDRGVGLPGIGVFSGDSGYGKSVAAQYAMNKTGTVYIEVRHYWRQKRFARRFWKNSATASARHGRVPHG
ncbi:MAG: hypothetical protein HPM95_13235 [Alphaproteobacteria bacterium]|nr:hypothetical protein [Alphaproteobacteria bacterium]